MSSERRVSFLTDYLLSLIKSKKKSDPLFPKLWLRWGMSWYVQQTITISFVSLFYKRFNYLNNERFHYIMVKLWHYFYRGRRYEHWSVSTPKVYRRDSESCFSTFEQDYSWEAHKLDIEFERNLSRYSSTVLLVNSCAPYLSDFDYYDFTLLS